MDPIDKAITKLYFEQRKTYDEIVAIMNVGKSRISKCVKYYRENNEVKPKTKRGRHSLKTPALLTYIMTKTMANRRISCSQISKQYSQEFSPVSKSSIQRYRHELKMNYRPPKLRPNLSIKQKDERYKFSQNFLKNDIDYSQFVFSDESKISFTSDNRYIWYIPGETDDSCYQDCDKVSPWIMVWGAIGYNYKSPLIICPKSVTADQYRKVITDSNMVLDLNEARGEGNWVFQQDGATPHTAKTTRVFLNKRMSYIEYWPANSPDMNPIEHLWAILKYRILEESPEDFQDMLRIMQEEWESISIDLVNKLVLSFKKRLLLVSQHKGEAIGHLIKNYDEEEIEFLPDANVPDRSYIYMINPEIEEVKISENAFTLEEDILLLNKVQEIGRKWKKITAFFTDRSASQLRSRYIRIRGKDEPKSDNTQDSEDVLSASTDISDGLFD